MPQPITINSVLSVTIEGLHEGQQVINDFHYIRPAGAAPDGLTIMNQFMDTFLADNSVYDLWRKCVSTDVTGITVSGQWIDPTRYAYVLRIPDLSTGALAPPTLPCNTAVAITRRGDFANRHNISTIHMPGVVTSKTDHSHVLAPATSVYQTLADISVTTLVTTAGEDFVPIAFNRLNPEIGSKLTTSYVQPTLRVMRRRTVGLGK